MQNLLNLDQPQGIDAGTASGDLRNSDAALLQDIDDLAAPGAALGWTCQGDLCLAQ